MKLSSSLRIYTRDIILKAIMSVYCLDSLEFISYRGDNFQICLNHLRLPQSIAKCRMRITVLEVSKWRSECRSLRGSMARSSRSEAS